MTKLQLAKRLHARIKEGWTQNAFEDEGRVCLVGGIQVIDTGWSYEDMISPTAKRLTKQLAKQPQVQLIPFIMNEEPMAQLTKYNDNKYTTKRKVLRLISQVINQLQEEKTRRQVKKLTKEAIKAAHAATMKEKVNAVQSRLGQAKATVA